MQQNNTGGTSKEIIRANFILSLAIMCGTAMFLIVALVVNQLTAPRVTDITKILEIVVGIVSVICLVNAFLIYNKRVKLIIESNTSLQQKLNDYRAIIVIYFAMLEGAAIFGIIAFFLTGEYLFVAVPVVMLAAMLIKLPTKNRVINQLQLNWQEQGEL